MAVHVTILGWLYVIFSGLILSLALAATFLLPDSIAPAELLFFVLISLPGLLGGIGLLKRWPWIRNIMLILGAFNLLNFPFGTALGIYTLWVLWSAEVKQLFEPEQN